jgi:cytochrome c oxidase subunit 1/cytochrome c oxidase subunit I+III
VLDRGYLLDNGKETLGVTPLDAQADVILKMPADSLLPIAMAIGLLVFFGGLLVHATWLAVVAGVAAFGILTAWFRPHAQTAEREEVRVHE